MNDQELPKIELDCCSGCGICVSACSARAIELQEKLPVFIHPERCTFCTECERFCPQKAIRCEFEIIWQS